MLEEAWRTVTRARNAIMLVRDKPIDQLPRRAALVGVGRALGYAAGFDPGQLIDDYRRTTRRARRVVEQVFYGGAAAEPAAMTSPTAPDSRLARTGQTEIQEDMTPRQLCFKDDPLSWPGRGWAS